MSKMPFFFLWKVYGSSTFITKEQRAQSLTPSTADKNRLEFGTNPSGWLAGVKTTLVTSWILPRMWLID